MRHQGSAWTRPGRRLRALHPSAAAGAAGAVLGAPLVVAGSALQEQGVAAGVSVRILGGILLLGGLGVVLFGDTRRRAAAIDAARRVVARYTAATGQWRRPNRVGLALVAIGLLLWPPALVVQIVFGTAFAIPLIAPGIALFWVGVALIGYANLQRGGAGRRRAEPPGGP